MKTYFVIVETSQTYEVQAPSEEAAKERVEKELKANDPRANFRIQVAKEIILDEKEN